MKGGVIIVDNKIFNRHVKEQIDAGLQPFEIQFYPIVDLDDASTIAYRCKMLVHSMLEGELREQDYSLVSDNRDVAKDLLLHGIRHLIKCYRSFVKKDIEIEFLSIRCPAELPEKVSLYDCIKELLDKYRWFDPSKLCIEFPATLLEKDEEKVKYAILDLKLLKVKTAIIGCGSENFMLSKFPSISPDFVYLDETMTSYAGSRDKPMLVNAFVNYMKSMYIEVIAEGDEEYRKPLRNTDCIGFYRSGTEPLTLEQALAEEDYE